MEPPTYCSEHGSKVKANTRRVQLHPHLSTSERGRKFTIRCKQLMLNALMKQELMKGRAEIEKGEEPFKKGALRGGKKYAERKETRALKN